VDFTLIFKLLLGWMMSNLCLDFKPLLSQTKPVLIFMQSKHHLFDTILVIVGKAEFSFSFY
jgi:hypothetical protein